MCCAMAQSVAQDEECAPNKRPPVEYMLLLGTDVSPESKEWLNTFQTQQGSNMEGVWTIRQGEYQGGDENSPKLFDEGRNT